MPEQATTLKVLCNPYVGIDAKGRPAGALLLDPVEHRPYHDAPDHADPTKRWENREFLGAKRVSVVLAKGRTVTIRGKLGNPPVVKVYPSKMDHSFDFSKDVVEVPNTKYYQRALQVGDLFAADVESWVAAGGDPYLFQDPSLKLAHAKAGAVANFIAHHGESDSRLAVLAAHWDGHVEQLHPVAKALSAKAAPKAAAPAAPPVAASTPAPKGA